MATFLATFQIICRQRYLSYSILLKRTVLVKTYHHSRAVICSNDQSSLLFSSSLRGIVSCRRFYGKKKAHKIELTPDETGAIDVPKMKQEMTTVLNTLKWEYDNTINAKITPKMVGNMTIKVGQKQIPLGELVQISLPNPQNIVINFSTDTSYLSEAVKELRDKYHCNPIVSDSIVKIPIPRPSKELRDKLAKDAKGNADKAKVTLRRVRQQSIGLLRKKKDTLSKDSVKRIEDVIQVITDEYNGSVDNLLKTKTESLYKS